MPIFQAGNSKRMKLLISNAEIIDMNSPFHGKICDVLVHAGRIEKISPSTKKDPVIPKGYKHIKAQNQYLMPGLMDMRADFCDPGLEHKETLESGAKVALSGGFTDVALLPSTKPPRDSKIGIDYVKNKSIQLPINLHPYGCLSKDRNGVDIAEMYDMFQTGAVGFTDGNRSVQHSGLLLRALIYNKIFGGVCLVFPEDKFLSEGGKMHEGDVSTSLGLKGVPSLAEELMVHRDIELVKYSQGKLHFSGISSKGSVEIIRKAKKQGIAVTADVCFANLCFTDENLKEYDSNFKLVPHLRGKSDQKALWEGVQDGTIDAIVSNHHPQDKENKALEFEYALPGMITLQAMLPILWHSKPKFVSHEKLIQALSFQPRQILNIQQSEIKVNEEANFILFDPKLTWLYEFNHSKSENTPFLKTQITGAITHVFCKNQLHVHM